MYIHNNLEKVFIYLIFLSMIKITFYLFILEVLHPFFTFIKKKKTLFIYMDFKIRPGIAYLKE